MPVAENTNAQEQKAAEEKKAEEQKKVDEEIPEPMKEEESIDLAEPKD